MRDALKLFSKSYFSGLNRFKSVFLISPLLAISLILILWSFNRFMCSSLNFELRFFCVVVVLGLNVYPVMLRGWASNRKYTFLGGVRGVAQSISYEIRLAFILIRVIQICYSLRFFSLELSASYFSMGALLPMLFAIWVLSALAERNRTPFDFAEGERELVSGFNTEYGAGGFAIIFMAEYGRIYLLSALSVFLFIGSGGPPLITRRLITGLIFFWVWARSTFPRYRYDILINLAWKRLLPLRIFYLILALAWNR